MSLIIKTFPLGPLSNNCYVLYDENSKECIIFDPSFESKIVLEFIHLETLSVSHILITHAHFDHFAGVQFLMNKLEQPPILALHPADLGLWREGGGGKQFGFAMGDVQDPDLLVDETQTIQLAGTQIQIRLVPGHSSGSVIYYIPVISSAIVGDVIFKQGVGRTDLPGGSHAQLIAGIHTQVFSLPPETILYPGHGEATSVADEIQNNPYLQ